MVEQLSKTLNNERLKIGFKRMISQWHDEIKPKYIFLNETSATPWGYLIKAAWKVAYPNESIPHFYRIDPPSTAVSADYGLQDLQDYMSRRIRDKNAKIIVFDETDHTGQSSKVVKEVLSGVRDTMFYDETLDPNERERKKNEFRKKKALPKSNIYVYRGLGVGGEEFDHFGLNIPPARKVTVKRSSRRHHDSPRAQYRITARTLKDPVERIEALKYITELKQIGFEIGESIRQGESRENLERKVTSAIAISSLVLSLLFMSNNLTGNAIAVNSTATNWTGGILFIIGLVASLVYFKRK